MDSTDAGRIVVLLVLLLLSAFFSSAETSLMSLNKIRIKSLMDEQVRGAKTVYTLISNPTRMLSAILIGNNIVNLSASSLTTTFAIDLCKKLGMNNNSSMYVGLATGILTLLILIFGEIVPKSVATANAEKMALIYAYPIYWLTNVLRPVVFLLNKISDGFLMFLRIDASSQPKMTENELRTIVDVSHEEGVIESEERRMITNVVDFGDSLAKDVMTPKMDVQFADVEWSYDELIASYLEHKFTRLPVYKETRDDILGIINLKDVFFAQAAGQPFSMEALMREPYVTYEYKKTSELFFEMKQESVAMAIVLDEYGATVGIVTLEDLIEEIVGEIHDEYDADEEADITKISDTEYEVLGTAKLDDIQEIIGLELSSDDYDSIAGHIIHLLDHFPDQVGEVACDEFAEYTVTELERNHIDKVRIRLLAPIVDEENEEVDERVS